MQRKAISKIQASIIVAIVLVGAVVGAALFYYESGSNQNTVSFMLITPHGPYVWAYYGIDQGIYSKLGMNLSILSGSPATVVAAVAEGKAQFGFGDLGLLSYLAATQNITNVRIVAMVFSVTNYVVIYNKANITKPSDLNGKTESDFQGSGTGKMFALFAKNEGINQSTIKVTFAQISTYNSLVALGKVDFVVTTIDRLADVTPIAAENHIQLGTFLFKDYGINIYGFGLITTTQMIQNNPSIVQKFVQATLESIVQAAHNPQAATASFEKYNPQFNSTIELQEWQLTLSTSIPNANSSTYSSNPLTLGWIDQQRMQTTVNDVLQAYNIQTPLNATSLYTDQFVQQPPTS